MPNRLMARMCTVAVSAALTIALAGTALAVPSALRYTGRLNADNGLPFTGQVAVKAALFPTASSTEAAWGPADLGMVQVEQGLFSVSLDASKPALAAALDTSDARWLEFEINGTKMSPRQRLTSAPYSISAGEAALLGGLAPSDYTTMADLEAFVVSPDVLPTDGLDVLSNGSLTNELAGVKRAWVPGQDPLDIPDNNANGASALLAATEAPGGYIVGLSINATIKLKFVSQITIKLTPPSGSGVGPITLFTGQIAPKPGAAQFDLSWTPATTSQLGNLLYKDPSGIWKLTVIDSDLTVIDPPLVVGEVVSFDVTYDAVTSDNIAVMGDLDVAGDLYMSAYKPGAGFKIPKDTSQCNSARTGAGRYNAANGMLEFCNGTAWTPVDQPFRAMYRWAQWSTYSQNNGWYANNDLTMFGGVAPSNWGDGGHRAVHMSSVSEILRNIFWQKGPKIGTVNNATVMTETWKNYSSTNSRQTLVLFRVKNTTTSNVNWGINWYVTAYAGWGEHASIAMNGQEIWNGASTYNANANPTHTITVPANRTSTVIFIASSAQPTTGDMRTNIMAFHGNCLSLPAGLEFVDDLDVKPDGWDN